jgi:hypothetical protein
VWQPNDTKITSTTWSNRCSTMKPPSTRHLRGIHSTQGRLRTSRSQLATGYIKRPSGYASTMMARSQVTTDHKVPMTNHTPSISTRLPTIVSTLPSSPYPHGSDTCSLVQEGTSKFYRTLWLTSEIGVSPGRSRGTANSMMISWPWPSRSRSINVTWMPPMHAWDVANPDSCSREPQSRSRPYRMCQGRSGPSTQAGRGAPICPGVSMYVPCHWKMSRMYKDVHHRVEGDVTGLGAASRAGTHVSCATGQESVFLSE